MLLFEDVYRYRRERRLSSEDKEMNHFPMFWAFFGILESCISLFESGVKKITRNSALNRRA